jgi:flagellin
MASGGISIANNLLANAAQLNLNKNQSALKTAVTQLSSGLRINSAADDPSGLAISQTLQAQVNGFDQAVQNIQDATNAASVADGALQTTTDILQRIRSLAVEASSDITSQSDKANLQTEVSQLLQEVNRISQNTSFNGSSLLDGSHAGFQAEVPAFLKVTSNAALSSAGTNTTSGVNYGLLVATAVAANSFFNSTTPNGVSTVAGVTAAQGTGGTQDGTIELQVINTGASIAIQETFFQSATGLACVSSTLYGGVNATGAGVSSIASDFDNVSISFGNISTADVGVTSYIKISQNVAALSNPNDPAFNFQSGADEGSTIQVGFAATNTQTLRISNINLLLSSSSAPSLGAEDAIGQIDNALTNLLNERAQLGAVIVRLNEDTDNDNTAATNIQASESQIADLDVGAASTNFTRLNILVQTGTSILAQSNTNAQSVLRLFQ